MRSIQQETLDVIDDKPLIESWVEVGCDDCTKEGKYVYEGQDLCGSCLLERLIADGIVEIGARGHCTDCEEPATLCFGGEVWCAECLMLALKYRNIVKEV